MSRIMKLAAFLMVIALLGFGCSDQPNPVQTNNLPSQMLDNTALFSLPAGATLVSSTFYIYVDVFSAHTVDVHRATADWVETTVTWNSFGGALNAGIEGSFVADAAAWRSVDVTSMVQGWFDGTYDNYGLVLSQEDFNYPRTIYPSRENVFNPPYLEICYQIGSETFCEDIMPMADSYINELYPTTNFGTEGLLFTGWAADGPLEKQALVKFDLEVELTAELGDFVWIDHNCDGIQDTDEPGFSGVEVNLYMCDDTFVASTVTGQNGYYLFTGLTPGDYYVEFIDPEGYDFSPQDQGNDDAADSDVDPTTGFTICTTLEGGESDLTWDAGLCLLEQEGCSLTIGYWRNHGGFGPQADVVTQYLPLWLGDAGGTKSLFVDNGLMAHLILIREATFGRSSNGITKLYCQMLATKLNIAAGASDDAVAATIAAADAFLADHDHTDWNSLNKPTKKMVLGWMSDFDDYNNGDIGPGHCDD